MKTVLVRVRMGASNNLARAGHGAQATTASATGGADFAAARAAAKYFGCTEDDVSLACTQIGNECRGVPCEYVATLKNGAAEQPPCESFHWHYVEDEMPDDETRVLVAVDRADSDEVEFGFHADGAWWLDIRGTMIPLVPFQHRVYAWADGPARPPKKGGAS